MYRRQEHASLGESRTRSILLSGFWVLTRSVDADGADLLVQVKAESRDELRSRSERIETLGVVQAKYFSGRTQVRILRGYVETSEGPRSEFFTLLHSADAAGDPVHFFFTAEEIMAHWSVSRCGRYYVFRLGKGRDYAAFRNLREPQIIARMQALIAATQQERNEAFLESMYSRIYSEAGRHDPKAPFTYLFRIIDGAHVVLYRSSTTRGRARLLDPRRDLFAYTGDFLWGYIGTGPNFLAASLLGHHLDGRPPTRHERDRVLFNLISLLDRDREYDIDSEDVDRALRSRFFEGAPRTS